MKTVFPLAAMTSKEFAAFARRNGVVVLPVGAMEAHGPHLPLATDTLQPEAVAGAVVRELAKKGVPAAVAPTIGYGNCSTLRNFPGTLSVSPLSLQLFVKDILSELIRNGIRRIVVLSGHAGRVHMAALKWAAEDAVAIADCGMRNGESVGVRCLVFSDYDFAYELLGKEFPAGDGHGGDIETSRILALAPALVKKPLRRGAKEMPRFLVEAHPERHFPQGFVGDARRASAGKGRRLQKHIVKRVVEEILAAMV